MSTLTPTELLLPIAEWDDALTEAEARLAAARERPWWRSWRERLDAYEARDAVRQRILGAL